MKKKQGLISKLIAAIMKRLRALTSVRGVGGMAQSAEPEEAETEEFEHDPAMAQEALAQERKIKGYEPEDLQKFAAGKTLDERKELAKVLTNKTADWALSLDDKQRGILASAPINAIEGHMSQATPLQGLKPAPPMFGNQPGASAAYRPPIVQGIMDGIAKEKKDEKRAKAGMDLVADRVQLSDYQPKTTPAAKLAKEGPNFGNYWKPERPTPQARVSAKPKRNGRSFANDFTYRPPSPSEPFAPSQSMTY